MLYRYSSSLTIAGNSTEGYSAAIEKGKEGEHDVGAFIKKMGSGASLIFLVVVRGGEEGGGGII